MYISETKRTNNYKHINMKKLLLIFAAAAMLLAGCCNGGKASKGNEAGKVCEAVINNIMNRKSVRSFTGDKLSEEQITTLLKAAMAAPSAINIQPWSFIVVDDDAIKQKVWGDNWQAEMFLKSGAVFVICGQTSSMRKPSGQPDAEPVKWENPFWYEDCSAAAENLLLAAEAMGLGAVWTASYPVEDRMKPYIDGLGIPEGTLPLCAIPVGYPAGDDQPKDKWNPEKIHRNRW